MLRRASARLVAPLFAAVAALVASAPAVAHAEAAPTSPWDRHFAVSGQVDLFPMPMMDALVVVEVTPLRTVALEVGGGVGFSQRPMFLGVLHFQAAYGRWAPGVEIGAVTGPFTWDFGRTTNGVLSFSDGDVYYRNEQHLDNAVFGRAGVSVGYRTPSHFHLRMHAGVTGLLNRSSAYCRDKQNGELVPGCNADELPGVLPYLGATFGYAFDI
jgi:hypothetical protein